MRSRLLAIVLFLVVLVVLGLGIPLTLSVASREQQRLFLDRLTMTGRLASLAQHSLLDDQPSTISRTLQRYDQVHGIRSVVVDQDGEVDVRNASDAELGNPDFRSAVSSALAGRRPAPSDMAPAWLGEPLVLAEPVMVEGDVRGAVVTISPTDRLQQRVLVWWSVILVGSLCALGLAFLLALPVSNWILRPIRRLDEATGRVAAALAKGTAFTPVPADTGPAELRKLARDFGFMAASMSDVLAAQRAFVADASHQLRNPLTALHIRLSSLKHDLAPDATEDYVAAVAETRRLNQVLDELLTLARAESAPSDPVPADVTAILVERVETWQTVAASRGARLSLDAPDGLVVLAVPRAVETVLDALLDNAFKFGADGAVELTARASESRVFIEVRDHGPGLEPAELSRATDRFWRSTSHQNVSGSGLGLAIVRRLVERSGGTVRLELPEDEGLRVFIEFPAANGSQPEIER